MAQKIVLVGGCFDILHLGHTTFLEKAKKLGDILIVLLESDQKVKKLKGEGRPINNQKARAKVLTSLKFVDKVIMLPNLISDNEYDKLVKEVKADFIATTRGDKNIVHKKRQAKLTGAKLVEVTKKISGYSTSKLAKL